jgi:hypothetical protein
MVEHGLAASPEAAVRLGNDLLEANFFHHVTRDHEFKNNKLFYRFLEDEPDRGKAIEDCGGWEAVLGGGRTSGGPTSTAPYSHHTNLDDVLSDV